MAAIAPFLRLNFPAITHRDIWVSASHACIHFSQCVACIDHRTGSTLWIREVGYVIVGCRFSQDGCRAVLFSFTSCHVRDVASGDCLCWLSFAANVIQCCKLSPDGRTVAVFFADSISVILQDVADVANVATRRTANVDVSICDVAWRDINCRDTVLLASDDAVFCWNVALDRCERRNSLPMPHNIQMTSFSASGNRLLIDTFKSIIVWDVASATIIHTIDHHVFFFGSVTFLDDGGLFLAHRQLDSSFHIVDTASGRTVEQLELLLSGSIFFGSGALVIHRPSDRVIELFDLSRTDCRLMLAAQQQQQHTDRNIQMMIRDLMM